MKVTSMLDLYRITGVFLLCLLFPIATIASESLRLIGSANSVDFKAALLELNKLLTSSSNFDRYSDITASYYVAAPLGGGVLVKYQNSGLICTEGQAYAGFLLTRFYSANQAEVNQVQTLFDQIWQGSNAYFPSNGGLLGWKKDDNNTAADADLLLAANMYRAAKNQKNGLWKRSTINYSAKAKKLSSAFLNKDVVYMGGGIAIPKSGYSTTIGDKDSPFIKETEDYLIFQYNPSYTFELAVRELAPLDKRWIDVRRTQDAINALIFKEYGMSDWYIVKVNKTTGEISLGQEFELSEIIGHNSRQSYAPSIEWPRYLIGHLFNYIELTARKKKTLEETNSLQASIDVLDAIESKYSVELNGLTYSGYYNEILVSLSTLMKVIYHKLTLSDVAVFQEDVLGGADYFGNRYYNSSSNSFNQLLVGMTVQELQKIIAIK